MPQNQLKTLLAAKIVFCLGALICFVFAGVIVFWTVPESRAMRDKALKTPNISSREDLDCPVGADVSATGSLHKDGAAPGDYIVYVHGRFETRRSGGETERRWIVEENVRPSTLELRTEDLRVKLVAEKAEYPFINASGSRSSDNTISGFKEGQMVTCFGVLRSHGTEKEPPTVAFREIWGETWPAIKKELEEGYYGIPWSVPILVLVGLFFVGMVVLTFIAERRDQASN
jgi:hypothetical protein